MTSLIHRFIILIAIFVGIASCSSDPCESVPCVNGSCNEGICDCAPGFMGPACDQVIYNFVGEYRSTKLNQINCPNSSDNFSVNTNSENEVCAPVDDKTVCLEVLLRLEEDKTFFLNVITTTIDGSLRIGQPTVIRGTYTTSENNINMCDTSNDCQDMVLDMSQSSLTWIQVASSSTGCGFQWELSRQ